MTNDDHINVFYSNDGANVKKNTGYKVAIAIVYSLCIILFAGNVYLLTGKVANLSSKNEKAEPTISTTTNSDSSNIQYGTGTGMKATNTNNNSSPSSNTTNNQSNTSTKTTPVTKTTTTPSTNTTTQNTPLSATIGTTQFSYLSSYQGDDEIQEITPYTIVGSATIEITDTITSSDPDFGGGTGSDSRTYTGTTNDTSESSGLFCPSGGTIYETLTLTNVATSQVLAEKKSSSYNCP